MGYQSETAKQRQHTEKYCTGCGLDVASQGDPVVPWAWQLDLPKDQFEHYSSGKPYPPIQLSGDAARLPVNDNSLDFLYSSHLLEDYADWLPILTEWVRVIKPGGNLVILLPDRELWLAALRRGQPPNYAHQHEAYVGELSNYAEALNLEVLEDRLTNSVENDYNILFVAKKKPLLV